MQPNGDKVNEYEVWHDLANLYICLSHFKDAEICLNNLESNSENLAEVSNILRNWWWWDGIGGGGVAAVGVVVVEG